LSIRIASEINCSNFKLGYIKGNLLYVFKDGNSKRLLINMGNDDFTTVEMGWREYGLDKMKAYCERKLILGESAANFENILKILYNIELELLYQKKIEKYATKGEFQKGEWLGYWSE